ncbi:hypothetical protein [Aquabacter cavernae]|uniref:hypothetical protein n=1 Tax=Aquabacter cavernae TaxID=2496029 RepID=UPI0013DE9B78|nr:hypothetical protein [Aquabacter cavernae]
MSTVTLSSRKGYAAPSATAPKAGFFARLFDAIVAAQTIKAERELAHYLQRTGKNPLK